MARVYRARHEALQRHVALKVMTLATSDRDAADRFLREARMAAAIKHRNVVNIFDVGVKDGVPFMVMELLEGEDVEARLTRGGPIPEGDIIDIVIPVLAGLSAVHDAGIIHRDLKPGNIFVARTPNGEMEPKLLDFGISKSARTPAAQPPKLGDAPPLLMGTPLYMAPEVIVGNEPTEKSDQYSLGVVLYEAVTGINPFMAETMDEVMQKVTRGDVVPVLARNSAVSRAFARIIGRAMKRDPSERYPDLRAMGRELLQLSGHRTRITWGLTFGDIGAPSVWPHALSIADRLIDPQLSDSPRFGQARRWAPRIGACALALWLGGIYINRSPTPRDLALPDVHPVSLAASATEVPHAADTPAPTVAPGPSAEAEPIIASLPARVVDEIVNSTATASHSRPRARRSSARRELALSGAASVHQPATASPAATALVRTAAPAPEWALAESQALTHRSNEVGTNNAPILD